jgi:hypothetical protein
MYEHEKNYGENICMDFKNDSEGISQEENIWRNIGGLFEHLFVDINLQTNILKRNLKFILNLE